MRKNWEWKEKIIMIWRKWLLNLKKGKKQAVHYIGGSDVLPPPLSREEEEKLINEMVEFADNEEKIKEIKTILIERSL